MNAFNPVAPEHYAFWREALLKQRNNVDIQVPVDKPSCGFFKTRRNATEAYQPVAIWFAKDGSLRCKVGSEAVDPLKIWAYCAARPITQEEYNEALANGFPAPAGHNEPPTGDLAEAETKIEALLSEARAWLAAVGKSTPTQEQADTGAAIVDRLRKLKAEADRQRLLLTKPHRDAVAEINERWGKPITAMGTAIETLLGRITLFLKAQEEKAAEITRETGMAVEKPKAGKGKARRAITARADYRVEVLEPEKAAAHFAQNPKILEIVIACAKEEFKATGKNPPGCVVTEAEKAV